MKEGKPLAKHLCFVVRLDPQSLSCMQRPETFLQFTQDIFVHGITGSEIGSTFPGRIRFWHYSPAFPDSTISHFSFGFARSVRFASHSLPARAAGRHRDVGRIDRVTEVTV